ncbi:MAG: AmmeMemoRadiSam system radical SAM enzyme [Bacteroidales bacterium]|nr:AmmeMemoRadiSam system radical SAM enzyme [Bacteroidales bacterium]
MRPLFLKYDNYIECRLCPHLCKIAPGKRGICRVRQNTGDRIELLTYGVLSGRSYDPVEKKPLYHFFPGYKILSVGSYGCNMRCDFCQNWNISQKSVDSLKPDTDPDRLADEAASVPDNIGIAFTYNEPVIWFEFVRDTAIKIREKGLFNVMVSNGYINRDPLGEILEVIDAFNIDLKAFNEDFYSKLAGAKLEPVKESLKAISKAGKHLEITTLIIPGKNDSVDEMESQAEWIAGELGDETPLHLSRYFPMFKRNDPSTPQETLTRLYEAASKRLKYVYIGNTRGESGQDTWCSKCGTIVTMRSGYNIRLMNLSETGHCKKCGFPVYRNFTLPFREVR